MKGFVSEVVIIAITIASTIIVINAVNPIIEEGRTAQAISNAKQILKTVDAVVNQLVFEAPGAKRSVDIDLSDGRFVFSGRDDRIKVRLESSTLKSGTRIQEENIVIQGGGTLDAYVTDVLGDGQEDFVLENPAVLLAVKKLGSSDSPVFVNTSSIITLIRNKRQDVNVTYPGSGIFVDDKISSSYGQGYTELSLSTNAQTGSILLHMNSTANITYDAIFTMSAAADFFELEVKNVKKY